MITRKNNLNASRVNVSMESMEKRKNVLVAVLGTSPSVLTETVWAIGRDMPQLLPDEIHICSTSTGKLKIQEALSRPTKRGNTVWSDLKRCVGRDMHIHYHPFTNPEDGMPLSDIQDSHDQELVADQLLKVVRDLKNPMQENCRIVCSIAGGRKSMSALMYAVMSLAADSGDLITHVLADEAVITCPDYFYPDQVEQKLINSSGEKITAKKVHVELAVIPFVPLRSLVGEKQLGKAAGSFAMLVKRARNELGSVKPEGIKVRVSTADCVVFINDEPVRLPAEAHVLLSIMVRYSLYCKERGKAPESLSGKLCGKMYELLLKENRLPMAVLQRAVAKVGEEAPKLFYRDLEEALNDSFKGRQNLPHSVNKEKHTLKATLAKAGMGSVAEDSLPNKRLGFDRISDVEFIDKEPAAEKKAPAKSKAAQTKPARRKKQPTHL